MRSDLELIVHRNFRISLGSSCCRKSAASDQLSKGICDQVFAELERIRNLASSQIGLLPEVHTNQVFVGSKKVQFTIYRNAVSDKETIFVVQAFYSTWKFPNFLSLNSVGRIFVEGIVYRDGVFRNAADNELWPYK